MKAFCMVGKHVGEYNGDWQELPAIYVENDHWIYDDASDIKIHICPEHTLECDPKVFSDAMEYINCMTPLERAELVAFILNKSTFDRKIIFGRLSSKTKYELGLPGYTEGIARIANERIRQITEKDFSKLHDTRWKKRELLYAAMAYLEAIAEPKLVAPFIWPFDVMYWKPSEDPVRNLIKAGALIAAEIDRLG